MVHTYDILVHWSIGILAQWYIQMVLKYCYYIYCMVGITEAISFNVSSTIPPSPIPANTTLRSYVATTRDNNIVMRLPEDGSVVYSIL